MKINPFVWKFFMWWFCSLLSLPRILGLGSQIQTLPFGVLSAPEATVTA